jgi:putative peptide zinc metalloprotease protein
MTTGGSLMTDGTRTRRLRATLELGPPSTEGRVVVADPEHGRHYMVSAAAAEVLGKFDGRRTDAEVLAAVRAEGRTVTEEGFGRLLEKVEGMGLFDGDDPPPPSGTGGTGGPSRRNPLFFRVGEVDPSRLVRALRPLGAVLYSPLGPVLLLGLTVLTVVVLAPQGGRYVESVSAFGVFSAWAAVYVANALVAVCHELGHALAVHRYGGTVRRLGLAVYLFLPAAFIDASSAWTFDRTWKRIVVSLGGIYVEAFILLGCLLAWGLDAFPAPVLTVLFILAHTLLARIVANMNPFLRLDGYWIVSDMLEIPNLRPKAFHVLVATLPALGRRFRPLPFQASGLERTFLLAYGVLSMVFVLVGLAFAFVLLDSLVGRYAPALDPAGTVVVAAVVLAATAASLYRYVKTLAST